MDVTTGNSCSKDTNAVERWNLDSKESTVQSLWSAMINLYKGVCAIHLAALSGTLLSYCDQGDKSRKIATVLRNKQRMQAKDGNAVFGPPDKHGHFERKRFVD